MFLFLIRTVCGPLRQKIKKSGNVALCKGYIAAYEIKKTPSTSFWKLTALSDECTLPKPNNCVNAYLCK